MTPQQKRLLDAIEELTVEGVSPSYEQLMERLGLASKSGVHRLVQALKERGVLSDIPGRARSLSIVTRQAESVPFDRMAEAALRHVLLRNRYGLAPSVASTRAAMVKAFRGEVAQ